MMDLNQGAASGRKNVDSVGSKTGVGVLQLQLPHGEVLGRNQKVRTRLVFSQTHVDNLSFLPVTASGSRKPILQYH